MLKSMNVHDVHEAHDGAEALQLFETVFPHVLICEWEIEIMDGLEVWELLKRSGHETPAMIMMGSTSDRTSIQKLVKANVPAYLRKPFSAKDLGQRLGVLLKGEDLPRTGTG